MSEANKELVRCFYAAGTGNLSGLDDVVAEDYFDHHFLPGMPKGPEGAKQWFSAVLGSVFSEMRVEIDRMVAEGDLVDCHFALVCKHTADFGDLKAKGNVDPRSRRSVRSVSRTASWPRAGNCTTAATWLGRCRRDARHG